MASGAKIHSSPQQSWQILRVCLLFVYVHTQPGNPRLAHVQPVTTHSLTPLSHHVQANQEVAFVGPALSSSPLLPEEGLPLSCMAALQGLAQLMFTGEDRGRGPCAP